MANATTVPDDRQLSETEERNVRALHEMLQGFNTRNVNRMLSVFNEDMEWLDVPMEQAYRGRDEVGAFLEHLFTVFPDAYYDLEEVVADGNKLSAKFTMYGTHLGTFYGIPPTGRRMELPCLSLIEMRDGKFVYDHCYFDTTTCLRQLGLMPPLSVTDSPAGHAAFWLMVNRRLVATVAGSIAVLLIVLRLAKSRK